MVLSLKYGELSGTVSESNRLAKELGQYCDELSRKVQQKMYSVEGGMSSALNTADYYIKQKIQQLRTRESNARDFASKSQQLLETAKRVDSDVEKMIQANQKSFFQKNPELKAPWYKQAWTSFICDMKQVPVLGWLIGKGEEAFSAIDQLGKDIRYWWKCGGGKEFIMNCLDVAIKVGLAIAAVVTAVTAVVACVTATVLTGGAILFAVAACVTAVIAVVNAITNVVTSVQAIAASNNGNPAMSKIYSQRDTLAQVLREHNFHDKGKNRASNAWATGIEITENVAGIVLLVQSVGKIAGSFLSKNGVGFAFKKLVRGSDGKLKAKVTLGSIWKGTKAMILNQKLTTSTAKGLRTTLFTNIKQTIAYQAKLFQMAARDFGKWVKMKQVGDMGFFKNIVENVRLGTWHLKNTMFQFRKVNTIADFKYNLSKISTIVNTTNKIFSNTKLVINGIEYPRNQGILQKLSKKKLFDNDFIELLDKTGIGGCIIGFDKSGTIGDFTGIGNSGIIQKILEIGSKIQAWKRTPYFSAPSFQTQFPYYECAVAGGGGGIGRW